MNIIKESIKRLKIDSKVFTVDAKMDNSPACMLNKSHSFEVPRVDDSNYLKEILKIVHENSIKLIVPTIDTELKILSNNRNAFLEQNVEILISDRDVIEICQDKSRQKSSLIILILRLLNFYIQRNYPFHYLQNQRLEVDLKNFFS